MKGSGTPASVGLSTSESLGRAAYNGSRLPDKVAVELHRSGGACATRSSGRVPVS